jgi:membrane dipeptidase
VSKLHDRLIVIDGLNVSNFSRSVFEDMRRGGVTAANCTSCVWENFSETMRNFARWKTWLRDNADLITQVYTTEDIARAKRESKTGIILGWQNSSGIEDRLDTLAIFHELGLRIVQLTYNTQNLVGCGCYEQRDGGLSDFGRDVLSEMNRLGILCDLSHVGAKTSEDAIRASKQRVAYSHCLPAGLKAHPRNKSDEQLRFIADRGGFIGVTMFPAFLQRGTSATVDDYVEAIDYVIDLAGEDCVGIGTDFTQGYDEEFFRWITHDKGWGRRLVDFGPIVNPQGMRTIGDFPNLTAAMEKRGWPEARIAKVMGGNWLQLLADVWRR